MSDYFRHSTEHLNFDDELARIQSQYRNVYLIVSPPRCASTAVARTFWKFPEVSAYTHEPFESYYYESAGLDDVVAKLSNPISIELLASDASKNQSMVIKEMSFQVDGNFEKLAAISNNPLLFLIRNPLLSLQSRYAKKKEGGQSVHFPLRENGWEDLMRQVHVSRKNNIPYHIMDTTDFRANPRLYTQLLCRIYNVEYSDTFLTWQPRQDISLDNLGGKHDHLYQRVLSSTGILPPTEEIPPLEYFSNNDSLMEYIQMSLEIFEELRGDAFRLK